MVTSSLSVTEEFPIRHLVSTCGVCSGQSGTGSVSCPNISALTCPYHSLHSVSSCQLAFFDYPDWGFSVLFLSCKANARVKLAKTRHGPHPSQLVNCVVLCIACVDCVVLCIVCVDCVVLCIVCVDCVVICIVCVNMYCTTATGCQPNCS